MDLLNSPNSKNITTSPVIAPVFVHSFKSPLSITQASKSPLTISQSTTQKLIPKEIQKLDSSISINNNNPPTSYSYVPSHITDPLIDKELFNNNINNKHLQTSLFHHVLYILTWVSSTIYAFLLYLTVPSSLFDYYLYLVIVELLCTTISIISIILNDAEKKNKFTELLLFNAYSLLTFTTRVFALVHLINYYNSDYYFTLLCLLTTILFAFVVLLLSLKICMDTIKSFQINTKISVFFQASIIIYFCMYVLNTSCSFFLISYLYSFSNEYLFSFLGFLNVSILAFFSIFLAPIIVYQTLAFSLSPALFFHLPFSVLQIILYFDTNNYFFSILLLCSFSIGIFFFFFALIFELIYLRKSIRN